MLEIEEYYGIDDIRELDLRQREFNIPPTKVAPIIFDHREVAIWCPRIGWLEFTIECP